jgi:hypothetical protein
MGARRHDAGLVVVACAWTTSLEERSEPYIG